MLGNADEPGLIPLAIQDLFSNPVMQVRAGAVVLLMLKHNAYPHCGTGRSHSGVIS